MKLKCVFLGMVCFTTAASGYAKEELIALATPQSIPFQSYISGTGIVEASSDNISIGSPVNRIVEKVFVKVGEKVKKSTPLFQLENRDLRADLTIREVEYKIALAKLKRLESLPRPEDTVEADSAYKKAQIELTLAKNQYEMTQGLSDSRAISQDEINRRRYNYELAEANEAIALASKDKILAGTWKADLDITRLEVLQAKANVDRTKADIERTIVRSPINGQVLQVRIHEGEFPPVDSSRSPIMIVGNIDKKHLRVSINQFDASNFNSKAQAIAYLRGNSSTGYPLTFVELDPYLINKQNLTNDLSEKVDTKVLQVTYGFDENPPDIFVGQAMDVYIKTDTNDLESEK